MVILIKQLEDYFGVKVEKSLIPHNRAFQSGLHVFIIEPVHLDIHQINELHQLALFLRSKGDLTVAEFVRAKSGSFLVKLNDEQVVLLKYPIRTYRRNYHIPEELAILHKRGRSFPQKMTYINRIGQWKFLWEKRLDQMELFWQEKVKQQPKNEFDKLFIHSFPYYLGLTENAIQYVVDTELDSQVQQSDSATICHLRFTGNLYRNGVKIPTDWVFDHCSRDLAEWMRHSYFQQNHRSIRAIENFLERYTMVAPLSDFSWRLLYARLLFPIHYFECIEDYYINEENEGSQQYLNRLNEILRNSNGYEQFLAQIHQLLTYYSRQKKIPTIPWLKKA